MSILSQLTEFANKVFAFTQSTEKNTAEIKKLQQQIIILAKSVKNLERQLEQEKENNKYLQEMYELKIQNLKSVMDNKLKDYEIFLLRQDK